MISRQEAAPRFTVRDAYELARDAHAGQRQESDDSPFIEHPLAVAHLLRSAGFGDDVVAAGLLHDTVEGCAVTVDELRRHFGEPVADLVAAMTEPEHVRDYGARKAALRMQIADAGCEAAAIFAADKVANVQNLREALEKEGEERVRGRLSKPLEGKLEHYRRTLEMLEAMALSLSLTSLLREELESLDAVRSQEEPAAR